jgi:aspartate kinase
MTADPRIVHDAEAIPELTYAELREMAWLGAKVVHQDALVPLLETSVPLLVRDTRQPALPGTRVTMRRRAKAQPAAIAAERGFTLVRVEKPGMHTQTGVARRILELFELHDCHWHALPTSLHTIDVLVRSGVWQAACDAVLAELRATLRPTATHVSGDLARVALIGHGVARSASHAAHVCRVLDGARVRSHMFQAGATPHSITVAVDAEQSDTAVCALHTALIDTAA